MFCDSAFICQSNSGLQLRIPIRIGTLAGTLIYMKSRPPGEADETSGDKKSNLHDGWS